MWLNRETQAQRTDSSSWGVGRRIDEPDDSKRRENCRAMRRLGQQSPEGRDPLRSLLLHSFFIRNLSTHMALNFS